MNINRRHKSHWSLQCFGSLRVWYIKRHNRLCLKITCEPLLTEDTSQRTTLWLLLRAELKCEERHFLLIIHSTSFRTSSFKQAQTSMNWSRFLSDICAFTDVSFWTYRVFCGISVWMDKSDEEKMNVYYEQMTCYDKIMSGSLALVLCRAILVPSGKTKSPGKSRDWGWWKLTSWWKGLSIQDASVWRWSD